VEDVSGVIHAFLECPIKMWKRFCTASKTEALAQVVAALGAVVTVVAHDAGFNGDPLSRCQILDARSDSSHDAGGFMAED
jgi:hypothetical protein